MKAILMSIRPQHVANILNGLKTLEIRRRFPSDYVGWVYIYCTKDHNNLLHKNCAGIWWVEDKDFQKKNKRLGIEQQPIYNGKVVARFWCDKVEEIHSILVPFTFDQTIIDFYTDTFNDMNDLLKASCLDYYSLEQYLKYSQKGYAIHITNLEIFDKPKEISEFSHYDNSQYQALPNGEQYKGVLEPLTRAPQSFMFIEV